MSPSSREQYKSLLRRQRDLNREYEEFLDKEQETDEEGTIFPPQPWGSGRVTYINRRCAFERDDDGITHLITLPGQRAVGLKELRDFTVDTESLIVIDPYAFSGKKENAESIAQDFKRTARLAGKWLKQVHFVVDPTHTTNSIKSEVQKVAAESKIRVSERHSSEVHDRIWIADRARALVVGTSFNGLGGRASFLLPLPDPDLRALLEFLDERGLSRAEA